MQAGPNGFVSPRRKAGDFVSFVRNYVEAKRSFKIWTYRNWHGMFSHFLDFTNGVCTFANIDATWVERFKTYLLTCEAHKCRLPDSAASRPKNKPTLSPNTAKMYFERFLAIVGEAHKQRYLNDNPAQGIAAIKSKTPAREFLTLDELRKLAATSAKIPDALRRAALFSALTGLRFSDIGNLTWGNVRTGGGTSLHLQIQKTGERFIQPISDEAREILGESGNAQTRAIPGLKYNGYTTIYLERWAKVADIERKIMFHAFRRSYATGLLANGVDFHTITECSDIPT